MAIAALISGLRSGAHDTKHTIGAFCFSNAQPMKGEYTAWKKSGEDND